MFKTISIAIGLIGYFVVCVELFLAVNSLVIAFVPDFYMLSIHFDRDLSFSFVVVIMTIVLLLCFLYCLIVKKVLFSLFLFITLVGSLLSVYIIYDIASFA
jgi:hypothetical protein